MLQSLRGLKLPHRLFTALYRRTGALLTHCFKHPVKTLIFIVKAYLLLMLFCFFLVFSVGSFAQEPSLCEAGEVYSAGIGCGIPKAVKSCQITAFNGRAHNGTVIYNGNSISEYTAALSAKDKTTTGGTTCPWSYTDTFTHNFDYDCNSAPVDTTAVNVPYTVTQTRTGFTSSSSNGTCTNNNVGSVSPYNTTMFVQIAWSDNAECPTSYPTAAPYDGQPYCFRSIDEAPPCDCSELNGEGSYTNQSFLAAKDAYSQENPPACLNIRDSSDPTVPACKCQIVATKWFSQIAIVNGVEMTRWQPLPTPEQNGQSGIYTGSACGDDEDTAPPPEKENCIVMKNGQKMCLAEKKNKCIVLDGVEQCEAGCGTKNGEFICYEDNTPPIDPNEPLPEPDDNVTDPNKTSDQMTKQDFKEVNKGVETRLDLLAKLMQQNNAKATTGGAATGAKIDTTNRLLGEINGKLGELVAQGEGDGEGEGEGETNPQPDYNTDALSEFVNPNDWENRNFGTVLQAATERMQQAPIFTSVETFFDVSITGTCPTWQTTASMPFGGSFDINIDQLCSPAMEQIWPMIKAIILLGFSVMAFRAAVL